MNTLRKKITSRCQRTSRVQENSEVENLRVENANKDKSLKKLKAEVEYERSGHLEYQKLSANMMELLSHVMGQMSQLSRDLRVSIINGATDKCSLMNGNPKNVEPRITQESNHGPKSVHMDIEVSYMSEHICLNKRLHEVTKKLHEAERRLVINRDWISNAKSVLRERDLLLYDTRQLLKLKEKELAAYKTSLKNKAFEDRNSGDSLLKAPNDQIIVDEPQLSDSDDDIAVKSEPLLLMDGCVNADVTPPRVDYFAYFKKEVQNKKRSEEAEPELKNQTQMEPMGHTHNAYGNRAAADFHQMSDQAIATFL